MLYTGKGDSGTSKLFDCSQGERIGKDAVIFEALGRVDELTSYLGLCRVKAETAEIELGSEMMAGIIEKIQHNLFNVQAELAGADKHLSDNNVKQLEDWIARVEEEIPPLRSFTIPGGSELSAELDVARTLVRRAERYVVAILNEQPDRVSDNTLAYLNRLSSVFFALARLTNHRLGISEQPPRYDS